MSLISPHPSALFKEIIPPCIPPHGPTSGEGFKLLVGLVNDVQPSAVVQTRQIDFRHDWNMEKGIRLLESLFNKGIFPEDQPPWGTLEKILNLFWGPFRPWLGSLSDHIPILLLC